MHDACAVRYPDLIPKHQTIAVALTFGQNKRAPAGSLIRPPGLRCATQSQAQNHIKRFELRKTKLVYVVSSGGDGSDPLIEYRQPVFCCDF